MLEELKNKNKLVGLKQSIKALENDMVAKAFVALDADDKIKGPFIESCSSKNIEIEYVDTLMELGNACDINIGAAIAVILK